jgi:hypothetical protein
VRPIIAAIAATFLLMPPTTSVQAGHPAAGIGSPALAAYAAATPKKAKKSKKARAKKEEYMRAVPSR